jgi:hypothetical protein
MPDWEDLMKQAKEDVLCAVEIWGAVLEEIFGFRLEYAYAKGSAMKNWKSPIDYVPVVSDLDMHIMMTDSDPLFPATSEGFVASIKVAQVYEDRFLEERKDHLHIPRAQVVHINPNLDDPEFTLPQVSDVHVMVGSPKDAKLPKIEDVRRADHNQIMDLAEFLEDQPRQAFDRVGLDFWTMLRRMNWRVSPTPVRLLTQNHSSPLYVWKWNRTRIVKELRKNEYDAIADSYQGFYDLGWKLFLSNFTGYTDLRNIVVLAHDVLQGCLDVLRAANSPT